MKIKDIGRKLGVIALRLASSLSPADRVALTSKGRPETDEKQLHKRG